MSQENPHRPESEIPAPTGGGGDSAPAPGLPTFRAPGVETEAPRSTGMIPGLLRFFVVPLALVLASLAVFAGLGAIVESGSPGTEDLVTDIAGGGKNARWQAAQDLANRVARGEVDLQGDERLVRSVVTAFERARAEGDDPRVLQMFAVLLGRSPAPVACPVLVAALADGNPDLRIYVLAALAELGDPASVPAVSARTTDLDAGVRTMAVFTLASILEKEGEASDPAAAGPLVKALEDAAVDVRWNAALGLARLGRVESADLVWQMLHRDYVRAHLQSGDGASGLPAILGTGGVDPASPEDLEERVVLNAVSAAWRLRDRTMMEGVKSLAEADPSPSVRDWALRTRGLLEKEIAERGPVESRTWTASR